MNDVEMKKEELLEILKENRESHKTLYEEAVVKYHERLLELLDSNHDALLSRQASGDLDKPYRLDINLPIPEEHLEEYDGAIRMVELDVRETIKLDDHDFATYVLDKWSWKGRFAANTASYAG